MTERNEFESLQTKEGLTEHLLYFRDDWIKTSGCKPLVRLEGRFQWYFGIVGSLSVAKDAGIFSEEMNRKVDGLLDWWKNIYRNNHNKGFPIVNNDKEIANVEKVINDVLDSFGTNRVRTPKDDFINMLYSTRYDWVDIIPKRIVHSADNMYKVRRGWFTLIRDCLQDAIYKNILSQEDTKSLAEYKDWMINDFLIRESRLTTLEDIKYGNSVLDGYIKIFDSAPGFK